MALGLAVAVWRPAKVNTALMSIGGAASWARSAGDALPSALGSTGAASRPFDGGLAVQAASSKSTTTRSFMASFLIPAGAEPAERRGHAGTDVRARRVVR